jgi:hypothetical protein
MSQRRSAISATNSNEKGTIIIENNVDDDKVPFMTSAPVISTLSLEDSSDIDAITFEERSEQERHLQRVKHWRESPFAVGLVEPTWKDQTNFAFNQYGREEMSADETGCLCFSAYICPLFGAGRVGNMVILRSSTEYVEEVTEDSETGGQTIKQYTRPKLDCVVGPYWPMLAFVTYPLILGLSGWTFFSKILPGRNHLMLTIVWTVLTLGLIISLALTACRDPGILYRYKEAPPQYEGSWRWSERTLSYRPRAAIYDIDAAVVVEQFDHTCPWVGTAIGKKNMLSFQCFVCLVFVCLMMDIFVLTGVFDEAGSYRPPPH